jgi:hypothetical protein
MTTLKPGTKILNLTTKSGSVYNGTISTNDGICITVLLDGEPTVLTLLIAAIETYTINTPTNRRLAAINKIYENHIGTKGSDMGELINSESFAFLASEVYDLYSLSRTEKWHTAIHTWIHTIQTASDNFAETNGFDTMMVWNSTRNDYTQTTGDEFAQMMSWSITHGAIQANYGA